MIPKNRMGLLALTLALAFWLWMVIEVPTFDFDESLYRRVAETMRERGDPWFLAWDERPLHHKPPLFYWLIWAAGSLIDSGKPGISALSARIPSLLASLGIWIGLLRGTRFVTGRRTGAPEARVAAFAFLAAGFPLLTGTAVIFDPWQTLALLPTLLIPARMFRQEKDPSRLECLFFGFGLALATAIKGLNGFVIPGLALGIGLLLHFRRWGLRRIFRIAMRFFAWGVLPALAACIAWFLLLDQRIGRAFTEEFFWVQHLGRSQSSMENHSGTWLYHPLVLFFGSGFLAPLFFQQLNQRKADLLRDSFPWVYALCFVFVFSVSATKLPHYLWPAWPALALFCGMIETRPERTTGFHPLVRRIAALGSALPVIFLGALLFFLALLPESLPALAPKTPLATALLRECIPFSALQRSFFFTGAAACALYLWQRRSRALSAESTALFSVIALGGLCLGALPALESMAIRPFDQIARDLKAIPAEREDCIRYSGAFSATLSLALAPELLHNRCEPEAMRYLISPEWKAEECVGRGFEILSRRGHLVLCGKTKGSE